MKTKPKNFKKFIHYLVKNYLSPTAKFPHEIWNYFETITEDFDMAVTAKSLKNMNLMLKIFRT